MVLYKLTDRSDQTYNNIQWGENITNEASGNEWIDAYTDPLLAVLLNPIHMNFNFYPNLWESEGEIGKEDNRLKVGCKRLTTIRRIKLPEISCEQKIKFSILCAKKVFFEKDWNVWADEWLSGKNRNTDSAYIAGNVATHAIYLAIVARADSAINAADSAVRATLAARAADSDTLTTHAAESAVSATLAAGANTDFDLIKLAQEAIQ